MSHRIDQFIGKTATKSSLRKRSFHLFDDIAATDKPSDVGEKATVHGVIMSLSPTKRGKYLMVLSDASGSVCVIRFSDIKRTKLERLSSKKER